MTRETTETVYRAIQGKGKGKGDHTETGDHGNPIYKLQGKLRKPGKGNHG